MTPRPSDELRFDGRVAIVTGAGRGLGRAYALLLAQRGASVVVNDLGGTADGTGGDNQPAMAVVQEIVAAGGDAVVDSSDISTGEGAQALIDTGVDRFGRLDVLVNNAGIIRWAGLPEADEENLARHLAVHTIGSFLTTKAAWPHMVDQGYGRVVMTTSSGIFGLPKNTSYATAKAGVIGMARSLASAGARHGIKVNLIAPAAATRMGAGSPHDDALTPESVAPMVVYLAHEDCPVTGEMYAAGAGRFARMIVATTPGYVHAGDGPTPEDVARHWDAVNDAADFVISPDLLSWSQSFLSHLAQPDPGSGRD